MSVDFLIYTWTKNVPDGREFCRRLEVEGQRVRFPEVPDLLGQEGFLPVLLDGRPSGFEVDVSPITDEERAMYRRFLAREGKESDGQYEILMRCDLTIMLSAHPGDEAIAAEIIARALATASRGYFCDPQTGEVISPQAGT
jgi:hypothetical protein